MKDKLLRKEQSVNQPTEEEQVPDFKIEIERRLLKHNYRFKNSGNNR
jgi:hypothetical protein